MTTDLDRIRLAAIAELERFEADERRRLAYADRAGTLEVRTCPGEDCHIVRDVIGSRPRCLRHSSPAHREYGTHDPSGRCRDRNCDYEVGGRWSCEYPPICPQPPLADGTGRHSRKEMEQRCRGSRACGQCPACFAEAAEDVAALAEPPAFVGSVDDLQARIESNVSFTSVPQLCAAYEYALETMRSLYLLLDLKQHAWQPEQDVMREARRLLLAAGKDVE